MSALQQFKIQNLKFKIWGKGFTLVELMIAITIVAIISSIGLVSYSKAQMLGRDTKRKQDLRSIAIALQLYYQTNKRYPCTAGWQESYQNLKPNNWISDTCAADATLSPQYINQVPVDPMNTGIEPWKGTNYSYIYWSASGFGTCTLQGQNYILLALLENTNDSDSLGKKLNFPCGVAGFAGWGVSPNSFVISN